MVLSEYKSSAYLSIYIYTSAPGAPNIATTNWGNKNEDVNTSSQNRENQLPWWSIKVKESRRSIEGYTNTQNK